MTLEANQSNGFSVKRKTKHASKKKNPVRKRGQKELMNKAYKARKIDPKVQKFLSKKARDYNSDDEEDENERKQIANHKLNSQLLGENNDDNEAKESKGSEDEEDEIEPGIAKFSEGFRAFKIAFNSIMKIGGADSDPLGPVLSAHKKLVAEKLAEEDAEKKARGETKKEKHMVAEKGHVKPDSYLNTHEKILIGVATKGVVKLFNAVTKAQNAQKGLNPSRTKDANVIKKRKKEAFYSEITKPSKEPTWAPLRDNFMLTNSKIKNWDQGNETDDDGANLPTESSSDED